MQIYNSRTLDSNTRFILAILAGLATGIVLGFAYGFLVNLIHVQSTVIYVAIGWCIAYVIRTVGRGVHKRFAIASAVIMVIAIFVGDMVALFTPLGFLSSVIDPSLLLYMFELWLKNLLSVDITSLIVLAIKAIGIYYAYNYAVIL